MKVYVYNKKTDERIAQFDNIQNILENKGLKKIYLIEISETKQATHDFNINEVKTVIYQN